MLGQLFKIFKELPQTIMKTFKTRFKNLPVALAMLMLLQGCTVYKKQNVTMQAAAQEQVKTKVKTVNGNLYFKYISFELQDWRITINPFSPSI